MKLRIGLDIDDTICSFMSSYLDKFGEPREDAEITRNVCRKLIKDRDFWLNLPIINRPNFEPTLYCTKRIHPKTWTRQYLIKNDLPVAPIYQVYCQASSKAPRIKGRIDVFIDDSISNFLDLNLKGVPCLLIDSPYNRNVWGKEGRIFSLNIEEISVALDNLKYLLPHFKDYINGYGLNK